MLDDLTACLQFTIDANHNERRKDISFSFTGIYSTTGGDVGVIAPSLAEEEVAKINHDPKLPTGLHLEEETAADFRRHPSLEGKAMIKVSHDPIHQNRL